MYRLVTINEAPTYFPRHMQYTHANLTAFGIFMMVVAFSLLIYFVWVLMGKCRHCRSDKMYYKLMGENYELRKEYKRDFADLKEKIKVLTEDHIQEKDSQ